ncbi:MAG: 50S ribosomal protein L25 [Patescibacteria group bacterium]
MLGLSAKLRSERGRQNKQVREQGFIPAILYGPKVKNLALMVKTIDFNRIYQEAGESTLIRLEIEGEGEKDKKERAVLIHEVVRDPISDQFNHIDFNQVKMDEAISVEIPLVFIGQSEAVKSSGGILVKNIQEVEIEALPLDLIHEIEVDISALKTFEDTIRIKNLKVPEKVKLAAEPEEVVALVEPPRTEAEMEELGEKPTESVDQVEVEEKGKAKEEKEVLPADEKTELSDQGGNV